jgi:hypothetical protein
MTANDILKLTPTMMSIALMSDNYSFSKQKKKDFLKQGIKNIVGVNLIKASAVSI